MGDIEIISDSRDSAEFAFKFKKEEIVIISDDEESKNYKSVKEIVQNTVTVSNKKGKKPPRKKCVPVNKTAKKRKSSERDGNSKMIKRKCHLSEGECSKSVDKKQRKLKGKKMLKEDVLVVEVIDDEHDAKPLRGMEDIKESIMSKKRKMTSTEEVRSYFSFQVTFIFFVSFILTICL